MLQVVVRRLVRHRLRLPPRDQRTRARLRQSHHHPPRQVERVPLAAHPQVVAARRAAVTKRTSEAVAV